MARMAAEVYRPFRLVWRTFRSFMTTEEPETPPADVDTGIHPAGGPCCGEICNGGRRPGSFFRKPAGTSRLIIQLFL